MSAAVAKTLDAHDDVSAIELQLRDASSPSSASLPSSFDVKSCGQNLQFVLRDVMAFCALAHAWCSKGSLPQLQPPLPPPPPQPPPQPPLPPSSAAQHRSPSTWSRSLTRAQCFRILHLHWIPVQTPHLLKETTTSPGAPRPHTATFWALARTMLSWRPFKARRWPKEWQQWEVQAFQVRRWSYLLRTVQLKSFAIITPKADVQMTHVQL